MNSDFKENRERIITSGSQDTEEMMINKLDPIPYTAVRSAVGTCIQNKLKTNCYN